MCIHGKLTYRYSSCAVVTIFRPPKTPRCLLEKESYFCRILLEKKPSNSGVLATAANSYVCSVMNTRVQIRACPIYTILTHIHKPFILCIYVLIIYYKLISRNFCVLQDTITVSHKIRLRLVRHNHYSLIPTLCTVVVIYYYVLRFNSHLVCTPFLGRAQSPGFTFGTMGIPSLGSHLWVHILIQR